LGRTQPTTDEHIFDLGDCKQLSRKHAKIFYTEMYGGNLGRWNKGVKQTDFTVDDEWIYRKPVNKSDKKWIKKKGSSTPKYGFFAIECLSKNKVYVDGNRVDQGKMAILNHGSTIKMLTFTLYFLLPEGNEKSPRMVSVPHPMVTTEEDETNDVEPPQKKIKKDVEQKRDQTPLAELIKEFLTAVETDKFERKHSMMSTNILNHAVQNVATDEKIKKISDEEDGISRTVIMDWIADSSVYEKYIKALLTKLEMKSYQQNLSKALVKGGYTRLGTTGRHVKWLLPGQKEGEHIEGGSQKFVAASPEAKTNTQKNIVQTNAYTANPSPTPSDTTPPSNESKIGLPCPMPSDSTPPSNETEIEPPSSMPSDSTLTFNEIKKALILPESTRPSSVVEVVEVGAVKELTLNEEKETSENEKELPIPSPSAEHGTSSDSAAANLHYSQQCQD